MPTNAETTMRRPHAPEMPKRHSSDYLYRKRWQLDRERGISRTVPADPIREHVLELTRTVSLSAVADAAGVGRSTVHHIRRGHTRRMNRDIARRILAVTLDAIYARDNEFGFVPNVGARRRIEALLAIGWRHEDINRRLAATGVRTSSQLVLHQIGTMIARQTHDAVKAVYLELADHPGPSACTRARASRRGYLPPLWWDDDTIDDPDHDPRPQVQARLYTIPDRGNRRPGRHRLSLSHDVDPVVVERLTSGNTATDANPTERYAAYAALRDRGHSHSTALEAVRASSSMRTLFATTYTRDHERQATG